VGLGAWGVRMPAEVQDAVLACCRVIRNGSNTVGGRAVLYLHSILSRQQAGCLTHFGACIPGIDQDRRWGKERRRMYFQ